MKRSTSLRPIRTFGAKSAAPAIAELEVVEPLKKIKFLSKNSTVV